MSICTWRREPVELSGPLAYVDDHGWIIDAARDGWRLSWVTEIGYENIGVYPTVAEAKAKAEEMTAKSAAELSEVEVDLRVGYRYRVREIIGKPEWKRIDPLVVGDVLVWQEDKGDHYTLEVIDMETGNLKWAAVCERLS